MGIQFLYSLEIKETKKKTKHFKKCLEKVKALEKPKLNLRPDLLELVSNSQLVESTDCSEKVTTLNELVLVPQFTWLPSSNTCPLKFSNWLVTLPEITRRPESSPDTCNWPSETMKN